MLIKDIEEDEFIQAFLVIKEYIYLSIKIDNKLKIKKLIGIKDK